MPSINIGIIGFGTIGTGVIKTLQKNSALIKKRTGLTLKLKKIADKDLKRKRPVKVSKKLLTTDANEILDDPEIDAVVELIGGYHPAKEFIIKALKKGKYVATANKALIAKFGNEILNEARKNNVDVYFEASVGGGIPLILPMGLSLGANRILSIHAILNGTCNYILTKMAKEGKSFEEALKEAQQKGFAEANPTLDINGFDSMHKIVIFSSLAYGCFFKEKDIFVEGITKLTQEDIKYASELGYAIKLLTVAQQQKNNRVSIRVHPTMIPKNHQLATVENEMNAVLLKGDIVGDVFFYGKGAGMMPTASAVVADLINIAQDISNKTTGNIHLLKFNGNPTKKPLDINSLESKYYLRFTVIDKPGVLATISKTLAKNKISIASAIQKAGGTGNIIPLVLTTHFTKEKQIRKAIREIDKLKAVKEKTRIIRIDDLN